MLYSHSLLAVRLLSRIEKTFGKALPVATVFQAPTLEEVARIVREEKPSLGPSVSSIVEIQPRGSKPPLFLVHGTLFSLWLVLAVLQPALIVTKRRKLHKQVGWLGAVIAALMVVLGNVASAGYCFQIDLSVRTVEAGFTVVEVPITFTDRTVGESKMTGDVVREALIRVTKWGIRRRANQISRLIRR